MASPTTPTHGKLGALYVLRPNGHTGVGLNDVTWGPGSTAADLTVYEVEIDSALGGTGGVDTFKWRVNGGAYTAGVDITGAAQVLADGQSITFAATTGHTLADEWTIGNLKDEPTTESTNTAQITDATARLLNPNRPPTFTDAGGATVTQVNYSNGSAIFTAAVGAVTVTGTLGFIPTSALKKVGYLIDWSLSPTLDMADSTPMGAKWKVALPGLAGGSGSASAYFVATETLLRCLEDHLAAAGEKYFLLQLFNYDPDQDQTGDHFNAWVTFTAFSPASTVGEVVKESASFECFGAPSFTANV